MRPQARARAGARGGAASAARRVARPAQVGVRQGCERRIAPLARTRVGRRAASPQLRGGLALGNGRPVGSSGAASSRDRGRSCPIHRSEQRARHGRCRLVHVPRRDSPWPPRPRLGPTSRRRGCTTKWSTSDEIAPPRGRAACDHTLYVLREDSIVYTVEFVCEGAHRTRKYELYSM